MPRGGGGGFRGGGFSGGGFRGGGFRGGSSSFRSSFGSSSSFRSSRSSYSRPFGRTGATRNRTSHRGPYHRTHYRPYYRRRHHHYWYRPFYRRRWWYSPWFVGYYHRPWYYGPAFIGGGIIVLIIFLLVLLPLIGVAIAYPFGGGATAGGSINYRSTETLYFNEYWYEYEQMNAGGEISFEVNTQGNTEYDVISFAIADHPFDEFPLKDIQGSNTDSFTLPYTINGQLNDYEYLQLYLNPGSEIQYSFNSTAPVDFFIADGYNLYLWNNYEEASVFKNTPNSLGSSGNLIVSESQDYYLVWYNPETAVDAQIQYEVSYTATNQIDFDDAIFAVENTDSVEGTYGDDPDETRLNSDGTYYFFVYFDPFNSPKESIEITFDVTFDTEITGTSRWINARPTLLIIGLVGLLVIVLAVKGRKKQKEVKTKKKANTTTETAVKKAKKVQKNLYGKVAEKTQEAEKTVSQPSHLSKNCVFCGSNLADDAVFCPNCGRKREGRTYGTAPTTPKSSKICYYCGNHLSSDAQFCPDCGAKVEK